MPYGEEKREALRELNLVIFRADIDAIKRSTGVIANLDGVDVDSGTAAEIGFAYGLGLPILGYRGDFRLAADNEGGIVNLQVEGSILESAGGQGAVVRTIQDLPQAMLQIWGGQ